MRTLFDVLVHVVTRTPVVVLVAIGLVSVALAGFASQSQTVDDDAATVESPAVDAQEILDARFGGDEAVLQVVVRTPGQDVRGADGLRASQAIRAAVEDSPTADRLADQGPRPAILSFAASAEATLEAQQIDPTDVDDDAVAELRAAGDEQAPDQVADQAEALLADHAAGDAPEAGLVLVFFDAADLGDEATAALQRDAVAAIEAASLPPDVEVEPFSFALLFDDQDIGPEVGRLFGTAAAIILAVLATVYWVRPQPGTRLAVARRTAADVGLTLLAILLAIVWMQGAGVLLGPDYLGLIGYFSPQTQIVPILIIGLGVDYAIHVTARYREEVGAGNSPDAVVGTALRTAGIALALATATTVVGFLTNLASPVGFLRTFGVLAATGIAAAFVITLTLVPAGRLLLDRRAARRGVLPTASLATSGQRLLPSLAERTAWLAERAPVATIVVAVGLAGVGGYGFTQLDTQFSVTDFVPTDAPMLATFDTLVEDFGGGFDETTEVLLVGDVATPEAHNALVDVIDDLPSSPAVQSVGDDADADSVVSALGLALAEQGDELGPRLAEAGLTADGRAEAGTDVAAAYDLLLTQAPAVAEPVLARDGDGFIARVAIRTNAGESAAGALAEDLQRRFEPVADAGVTVTPTSAEIVQAGVTADIEDTQLRSLAVALAAAMLLLLINFWITARRPALGVLTIAPVGLVLAWTFGTMALTGIPLTPVTATLAALAIGIGVPFTIHVTHRFLEMRATYADAHTALRATARRTGGALAGSALTTVIGFGVLTTSTLVPFRQLGFVTVYAIAFALLAAVLVLPSILALWDRWHRRRFDHGSTAAAPPREPALATRED